jgi:NTP pyrophosphatase (non-canonical NTP hydrolase)
MFYIYHIPGKKIGVTRNLNKRVTEAQGYKIGEYEVLDSSEDIEYISDKELELQRSYGYSVDMVPYKNLKRNRKPKSNKMKLSVTEQTTTFPVPIDELENFLRNNAPVGYKWETPMGEFEITGLNVIAWILTNVHKSQFSDNRCYIYNKSFYEAFVNPIHLGDANYIGGLTMPQSIRDIQVNQQNIFDKIREWAHAKGIYRHGDPKTQYIKLQEESGELAKALLKNDEAEVIDAIGDMVVVLTNLARLKGYKIEDCIDSAYNVIAKRTGKMENGTFVKDSL